MVGRNFIAFLYLLAAIASWGSYFPFAKLILEKLSPEVFLIFRLGIGSFILFILTVRLTYDFRYFLEIRRNDLINIVLAGIVGIVLHQLLQLNGLKYTSATNTAWILTLIPLVTGILGWKFLGEKISPRQVMGISLAIIGVLFFISGGNPTKLSFIRNYGDILILGSVGSWSVYTVMTKSKLKNYTPLFLSTFHLGIGFLFFLLLAGVYLPSQIVKLNMNDWIIVIIIGIIPSGIAYYLWNAGLKRLSSVNTTAFLLVEAVIASIVGSIVLNEVFTISMLISAIIIALGLYITESSEK